jgi:hypothetical protein
VQHAGQREVGGVAFVSSQARPSVGPPQALADDAEAVADSYASFPLRCIRGPRRGPARSASPRSVAALTTRPERPKIPAHYTPSGAVGNTIGRTMSQTVFFLTRLKPGVDPAAYEAWVQAVDYPRVRTIAAVVLERQLVEAGYVQHLALDYSGRQRHREGQLYRSRRCPRVAAIRDERTLRLWVSERTLACRFSSLPVPHPGSDAKTFWPR